MKKKVLAGLAVGGMMFGLAGVAEAALITFDDIVASATSYQYDGDGDGTMDVVFSTTDAAGFNSLGPGPNMTFIQEPGIEGTTALSTDLRVDFLNGAANSLSFGFALSSGDSNDLATFSVYDGNATLLATNSVVGAYTTTSFGTSSFHEGYLNVNFLGQASYATFDFTPNSGRYIVDNFNGTFGSTEDTSPTPTPVPATLLLMGTGLAGLAGARRKKKQ